MRRIVLLIGLLGFLGFLIATPGPAHKVLWCHYPPGQWTGVTGDASHVLILSIDIAAEPHDAQVAAHLGHSPSLTGGPACDPTSFNGTTATGCAEGVTTTGDASGCPGDALNCAAISVCSMLSCSSSGQTPVCTGPQVGLVLGPIAPRTVGGCVCPPGTPNVGLAPGATPILNCGAAC